MIMRPIVKPTLAPVVCLTMVLAAGAGVATSACASNAEPRTVISVNQSASTRALTITVNDVVLEPARTEITYSFSTPDESKVHFINGPELRTNDGRIMRLRRRDFQADGNGELFTDVFDPAPDGAQGLILTW